jgi:16S rRNA (uracil1498-N3)-methyltransferase
VNSGPAGADAVSHVFVDALADVCTVEGPDGHHLHRVRRLAAGERITAADDTGAWRLYVVTHASSGQVALEAAGEITREEAPHTAVAIAVALTKGGIDDVVTSVTELGVARITPLHTARTIVRWDGPRAARAVTRLQTVARAAAMQSRRARLPKVDAVDGVEGLADRPALVVADHRGVPGAALEPPAGEWTVVVGPEGGFDAAEAEFLAARPHLAIGDHVLRASTAPIAAVAILTDRIAQMRHP